MCAKFVSKDALPHRLATFSSKSPPDSKFRSSRVASVFFDASPMSTLGLTLRHCCGARQVPHARTRVESPLSTRCLLDRMARRVDCGPQSRAPARRVDTTQADTSGLAQQPPVAGDRGASSLVARAPPTRGLRPRTAMEDEPAPGQNTTAPRPRRDRRALQRQRAVHFNNHVSPRPSSRRLLRLAAPQTRARAAARVAQQP